MDGGEAVPSTTDPYASGFELCVRIEPLTQPLDSRALRGFARLESGLKKFL